MKNYGHEMKKIEGSQKTKNKNCKKLMKNDKNNSMAELAMEKNNDKGG